MMFLCLHPVGSQGRLNQLGKLLLLLCVVWLTACNSQEADRADILTSAAKNESPGRIAARVGDSVIDMQAVEQPLRLALYDLQLAAFELKAAQLKVLIKQEMATQGTVTSSGEGVPAIEVFLQPPLPPRVELPGSTIPPRGPDDAPVTLALFCAYQSIHCVRLQAVLAALDEQYGALLRWEAYDFPMAVHRFGRPAANAARCAGEQGEYWTFGKSLYGFYDQLSLDRYAQLAMQLGLDMSKFNACARQHYYKSWVERDISAGEALGLSNSPVVFINGLYVKGPRSQAEYQRWIDWELQRQGIAIPRVTTQQASHPSSDTGKTETERPLTAEADDQPKASQEGTDAIEQRRQTEAQRPIIPVGAELPLQKEWLEEQLRAREELATRFVPASHVVEGHALLRLEDIADKEFYQALGLQEGDVVMQVDGEWVHSEQNPLWESLEQGLSRQGDATVTLIYIRRGLPQRVAYIIQ